MIATFEINQNKQWIAFPIYNSLNFDERLDEQLDTGNVQIITNTEDAFEDFIPVRVSISDGETVSFYYYYGFDAVEKRGKDYFIHSVELVEPTRLLMGVPIDGRKVSQPIDGAKKTLNTVVRELLNTFELKSTETSLKFLYEDQEELNVISPEFHWEAGTLLWECLLDIANVVNCMPRLIMTEGYDGSVLLSIVFDTINEVTAEYEL